MKTGPWRRRNILCAFRRRGDLGSGAENPRTYPEYREAMSKKGTSQNPGIPYLYPAKAVQAGMPGLFIPIFQTQGTRNLASFILFPFHNGHCDVFHGFSHFGVPDNKMNRRRFFLGHDRPASLMDKNLDMAERKEICFPHMVVFMHLRKALHHLQMFPILLIGVDDILFIKSASQG